MSDSKKPLLNNEKNNMPLFNEEDNKISSKIEKPKPPVLNIKPPKNSGLRKKKKETLKEVTSNSITLGSFLQEARVKSDYSLSQVAMITKLNIHYIEAIERNDFKNAPPYIYVKAYVKKLSELYGVDEERSLHLLTPFGESDKFVSDSILQELEESKQINEKEEKKIVFIMKTILITFTVVLILVLILYFSFRDSDSDSPKIPISSSVDKQQIQKKMEKLIVPQTLTPSELEIPKNNK